MTTTMTWTLPLNAGAATGASQLSESEAMWGFMNLPGWMFFVFFLHAVVVLRVSCNGPFSHSRGKTTEDRVKPSAIHTRWISRTASRMSTNKPYVVGPQWYVVSTQSIRECTQSIRNRYVAILSFTLNISINQFIKIPHVAMKTHYSKLICTAPGPTAWCWVGISRVQPTL